MLGQIVIEDDKNGKGYAFDVSEERLSHTVVSPPASRPTIATSLVSK